MPHLTVRVDQTEVNYEKSFVYTLDVSFSGIEGTIERASVRLFVPNTIEIFEGYVTTPIKAINKTPVDNGTLIIYEFETIQDLGIATRIGIGGRFNLGTATGTTYLANPQLWVNDEKVIDQVADSVKLVATQRFQVKQEIVLPIEDPTPGGIIYYKVTLQNFGDKGTALTHAKIKISPNNQLTLDTNYTPRGYDQSEERFEDTTQDGVTGIFSDEGLIFNLSRYTGHNYTFCYKAQVNSNAAVGTVLSNSITFSADGIAEKTVDHLVILSEVIRSASTTIIAPTYTLENEPIQYAVKFIVDGNTDLYNVTFVHDLPIDVHYTHVKTGRVEYSGIDELVDGDYEIRYYTTGQRSGLLGTFNTTKNTTVSLEGIIPEGDNLKRLVWELPGLLVGMTERESPTIIGKVKEFPASSTLRYTYQLSWAGGKIIRNYNTDIEDKCVLTPLFAQENYRLPVNPSGRLRYLMGIDCLQSRISNPLIAMLLPETLTYVGNEEVHYTDIFDEFYPDIIPVSEDAPDLVVLPNFENTGRTLVKMSFKENYNFHQGTTISILFDVEVKPDVQGMVLAEMYLNTFSNNGVIPDGFDVYEDTLNIAEDSMVLTDYVQSDTLTNLILFFASVSADKKVKGEGDTSFVEEPFIGKTYDGGDVQFKLSVTNTGTRSLTMIDLVDILPYNDDVAVIEIDGNTGALLERKSTFKVYSINEIHATIFPLLPSQPQPKFELLYSMSQDPVRFGTAFTTIGTVDDWTASVPEDMTLVRSLRVKTKNTFLEPGQTLEVMIFATVPTNMSANAIAWNSFAVSTGYLDLSNQPQQLMAVEPEKAGIQIISDDPTKVQVGGFVWIDHARTGMYDSDTIGQGDIGIILYDENKIPIKATFTSSNRDDKPGYYRFSNLEPGKYLIRALVETNQYTFTKQVLEEPQGSKVNSRGLTPFIQLFAGEQALDLNVGILPLNRIHTLLDTNTSARHMMRHVIYDQLLITMKYEEIQTLI